ncbi:MAG TPA: response regulator [Caldimonas sp.]
MQRILVVEDNSELRETLVVLIEDATRAVTACASAEEALREFVAAPFDAVFTDMNLPRMSGLDLATLVREIAPATWIVFSSGAAPAVPVGDGVRFLGKPFTLEALDALLAEISAAPAG